MTWEACSLWFTRERYEMRMIRPDLWIVFGPDGWVDTDTSMENVKRLAEDHLRTHPVVRSK